MTNEMKLLTALCEALGFDVERVCADQGEEDDGHSCGPSISPPNPIYEYKLTKKAPNEAERERKNRDMIMGKVTGHQWSCENNCYIDMNGEPVL